MAFHEKAMWNKAIILLQVYFRLAICFIVILSTNGRLSPSSFVYRSIRLWKQKLNCSDSDDESDIEDDIEAFENLYIEYTCEKIDDPTMEAENNPIAFTINDIVGDPADHYKFRTKSHIRREFLIRVKVNGVSRSYPNNPHNPLPRLAFSPETLPLVVLPTTTRCRRVDRELALSWISLMD